MSFDSRLTETMINSSCGPHRKALIREPSFFEFDVIAIGAEKPDRLGSADVFAVLFFIG